MSSLFIIILSIFHYSTIVLSDDGTRTCFACASPALKSRWQLTGLPTVNDQYFVDCNDPSTNAGSARSESCSGPCFVYMFDDPDNPPTNGVAGATMVVRGCHSTVMQMVADRSQSASQFCEMDSNHEMANSKGNEVNVRALMEFCTGSQCNTRPVTTGFSSTCSGQNTNNLLNNQRLNCYDCIGTEGKNCNQNKCTKKYCTKQIVKLGGGYQLSKSCSDINIYGVDNYCMTSMILSTPGGIAVQNKYTQCYCKNKQYCNSSHTSLSLFSFVFTAILSYVL